MCDANTGVHGFMHYEPFHHQDCLMPYNRLVTTPSTGQKSTCSHCSPQTMHRHHSAFARRPTHCNHSSVQLSHCAMQHTLGRHSMHESVLLHAKHAPALRMRDALHSDACATVLYTTQACCLKACKNSRWAAIEGRYITSRLPSSCRLDSRVSSIRDSSV